MALFVVQKPFNAAGKALASGEVVSDEGWIPRRSKVLCDQRYLRPCTVEEIQSMQSNQPAITGRKKAG